MEMVTHMLSISGPPSRGGRPSFTGVGSVMAEIGIAAREATCMRFRHASRIHGRRPEWLRAVADLNPVDIQDAGDNSKIVVLEAPRLGDAAAALYEEQGLFDTFPAKAETAIDVLSGAVGAIAARDTASEWYDTHLLQRLESLGTVLKRQRISAVGLGTLESGGAMLPSTTIDATTVEAAGSLHRQSPKSRRIRISGKLDMLRDSDRAFDLLLTDGGRVRGVWEEDVGAIKDLFQKLVVVDALAVFRPSGSLLRIEAGAMEEAGDEDAYFSRFPDPAPAKMDLRRAHRVQSGTSGMAAVYGRWPGDESEADLLQALRDLD